MRILSKKFLIITITISLMLSGMTIYTSALADEGTDEDPIIVDEELYDYNKYSEDISTKYPNAQKINDVITVNGADYTDTDIQDQLVVYEKTAIATPDNGYVEWTINVDKSGLYNIFLKFKHVIDDQTIPGMMGKRSPVVRKMEIDGKLPFFEANNFTFNRIWEDVLENGKFRIDEATGDEMRPYQKESESIGWIEEPFNDYLGFYTEPFLFYFEQGQHTIRLSAVREPLIVGQIILKNVEDIKTYAEVSKDYPQLTGGAEPIKIEAEYPTRKSSSQLTASFDRSSPATSPQHPAIVLRNTIGANGAWEEPSAWIEWDFVVPKTGLYKLSVRVRQNYETDMSMNRRIYIDGKVPFKEAEDFKFTYDFNWQIATFDDENNQPYYFYLEAGTHTIRLECTIGNLAQLARRVRDSVEQLQKAYRQLFVLIGNSPDEFRDYKFDIATPEAIQIFREQAVVLAKIRDDLIKETGSKGDTAMFDDMIRELKLMSSKPSRIASKFARFKNLIHQLSGWAVWSPYQPIELDYIVFSQPDYKLPKAEANGFVKIMFELKKFFWSFFIDYNKVGQEKGGITIWLGAGGIGSIQATGGGSGVGRDNALIMKDLIDNYFTPKTGIHVNLKLVTGNALLPAILSGNAPDLTVGMSSTDVINLAIRGAAQPLNEFPD
ncbi:MAG TPA: hypothetical protein PLZ84_04025, partial [Clostridia bacterium]|nr:hypothetical protein [Clostridia bacterium]